MEQTFGDNNQFEIYTFDGECNCFVPQFYTGIAEPDDGIECIQQILDAEPDMVEFGNYVKGKKVKEYPNNTRLTLSINGHEIEIYTECENIVIDISSEETNIKKVSDLSDFINIPIPQLKSARKV